MSNKTTIMKIASVAALILTASIATAGNKVRDSSGHPVMYKGMEKKVMMMDDKMKK